MIIIFFQTRSLKSLSIFFLPSRVLASIVILGKACDLIDHHQELKKATSPPKTSTVSPSKESRDSPPAYPESDFDNKVKSGPTVSSTEDMAILEAKLQTIERANTASTFRVITPPLPTVIPPPSEDNLDPIEEEQLGLGTQTVTPGVKNEEFIREGSEELEEFMENGTSSGNSDM